MEEENLGEITPEENQEGGEETPEIPPEKTEEEKSKDLQSALAQKEHFRSKAEKLEKELSAMKSSKIKEEPKEFWEAPSDPLEVVRLGKTLKDYTEEETEFIIRNAPSKDIKGIMEAEKDDWVKAAINAKREKVAKERALNPSTQQPEPEKVQTFGEKLKEANLSEKEKLLEEVGLWKSPKVRSLKDRIFLSK